jgi:hypothetical protein
MSGNEFDCLWIWGMVFKEDFEYIILAIYPVEQTFKLSNIQTFKQLNR